MSRIIITNSGSEFFTNISAEKFLGEICRDLGAKFYHVDYGSFETCSLAYSMTKDDTLYITNKLKKLTKNDDINVYYEKYNHFFGNDINIEEFKDALLYYAELFEKSEGYNCVS